MWSCGHEYRIVMRKANDDSELRIVEPGDWTTLYVGVPEQCEAWMKGGNPAEVPYRLMGEGPKYIAIAMIVSMLEKHGHDKLKHLFLEAMQIGLEYKGDHFIEILAISSLRALLEGRLKEMRDIGASEEVMRQVSYHYEQAIHSLVLADQILSNACKFDQENRADEGADITGVGLGLMMKGIDKMELEARYRPEVVKEW